MRNPYTKPLSELQGPTIDIEGFRNFGDICIVGKSSKKLVHSTVDSPTPPSFPWGHFIPSVILSFGTSHGIG